MNKYIVMWSDGPGKCVQSGEPMSEFNALARAEKMNEQWPNLHHWVQEVKMQESNK